MIPLDLDGGGGSGGSDAGSLLLFFGQSFSTFLFPSSFLRPASYVPFLIRNHRNGVVHGTRESPVLSEIADEMSKRLKQLYSKNTVLIII